MSTCINFEIFATKLGFRKTSKLGERSRCMVKLQESGFTVKTRRNLCLVWCAHKTRYLLMFRINCQIPRCVLTWVFGHRSLLL